MPAYSDEPEDSPDDLADQFEQALALLAERDWDRIWEVAPDGERRVLLDEFVPSVAVYPDHLEVELRRVPRLNVAGLDPVVPVVAHAAQFGSQRFVGGGGGEQLGEQDGEQDGVVGVLTAGVDDLPEQVDVAAKRAGVECREWLGDLLVGGDDEVVFGAPPRVHGRLGDPGAAGDAVRGDGCTGGIRLTSFDV